MCYRRNAEYSGGNFGRITKFLFGFGKYIDKTGFRIYTFSSVLLIKKLYQA